MSHPRQIYTSSLSRRRARRRRRRQSSGSATLVFVLGTLALVALFLLAYLIGFRG